MAVAVGGMGVAVGGETAVAVASGVAVSAASASTTGGFTAIICAGGFGRSQPVSSKSKMMKTKMVR